jgi:hypothetical protein
MIKRKGKAKEQIPLNTGFNIHQATLCLPLQKIVIIYTDDTGYVPFVEVTIGSFPHS